MLKTAIPDKGRRSRLWRRLASGCVSDQVPSTQAPKESPNSMLYFVQGTTIWNA